jgi:hypothetical protein
MVRITALLALAVALLALVACEFNAPPRAASDSAEAYDIGIWFIRIPARVPVDDEVYTIMGQVVADVATMSRQTAPSGTTFYGTYFGAEFGGKGFVRLLVRSSEPPTLLAQPGRIVLIKTTDTKASALLVGDVVTFRCRAQYEALAAVRINESFQGTKVEKVATWELDYCRLATPVISFDQE